MVHIYTVGNDGYVQITKNELEQLVKEAYDDGYKAGSRSTISINTTPNWDWSYRPSSTTSDAVTAAAAAAGAVTVKTNEATAGNNSIAFL